MVKAAIVNVVFVSGVIAVAFGITTLFSNYYHLDPVRKNIEANQGEFISASKSVNDGGKSFNVIFHVPTKTCFAKTIDGYAQIDSKFCEYIFNKQ